MEGRTGCGATRKSKTPAKGKTARAADAVVTERPLRPGQCRAYMRRELAREFPGIVAGFIEGAKAGSCQHVKLATELMKAESKAKVSGRRRVQEILEKLERESASRG